MKIKDCVVIEREVLKDVIIQLQHLGQNNIVGTLRSNSKPLEPIIRDAFNSGCAYTVGSHDLMQQIHKDLNQYLNETEI